MERVTTKNKLTQELYFIAIVPKEPLASQITLIKKDIKSEYQSSAALRSPPHITLHMPFKMDVNKLQLVKEAIAEKFAGISPFLIRISNFGAFPPKVIFIKVDDNEYLSRAYHIISEIMKGFNFNNQDYRNKGFHPHITIAFRDLRKREFIRAWEKYKEEKFESEFVCNSVCLLKHNGKFWEIYSEMGLLKNL